MTYEVKPSIKDFKDPVPDVGDGLTSKPQERIKELMRKYAAQVAQTANVVKNRQNEDPFDWVAVLLKQGPPDVKGVEEYFGDLQRRIPREALLEMSRETRTALEEMLYENAIAQRALWSNNQGTKRQLSQEYAKNKELYDLCVDLCKSYKAKDVLSADLRARLEGVGKEAALQSLEQELSGNSEPTILGMDVAKYSIVAPQYDTLIAGLNDVNSATAGSLEVVEHLRLNNEVAPFCPTLDVEDGHTPRLSPGVASLACTNAEIALKAHHPTAIIHDMEVRVYDDDHDIGHVTLKYSMQDPFYDFLAQNVKEDIQDSLVSTPLGLSYFVIEKALRRT